MGRCRMTKQEIFANLYSKIVQLSLSDNQKAFVDNIKNASSSDAPLDIRYDETIADNTNHWTNAALQYMLRSLITSNSKFELFCYDFCNHLIAFAQKLESTQRHETIRNLQVLEANQSPPQSTPEDIGVDRNQKATD